MPNIAVFLNKAEIDIVNKLCSKKGCNRYQLAKMAMQEFLEKEEKENESTRGKEGKREDSGTNREDGKQPEDID